MHNLFVLLTMIPLLISSGLLAQDHENIELVSQFGHYINLYDIAVKDNYGSSG